ncbi:aminodeoxychorismate synthase component I [Paenibacillus sp. EKM208P]|nr:aminodeoxychorismate synthase component I [Paenibacillus sp. EKM208P]
MPAHFKFDFVNQEGVPERIIFDQPQQTVVAYSLHEVREAMIEIQKEVNKGAYAAGYISYEAAPAFEPKMTVKANSRLPLLYFGIYDKPVIIEQPAEYTGSVKEMHWTSPTSQKEYYRCIQAIKDHISAGETYQVNYTLRLRSQLNGDYGDGYALYEQLRAAQQGNYSAYLDLGKFHILSVSPELFFALHDGKYITTRPMKGTIRRGRFLEEDINNKHILMNSEKDKAENLMIVDLLRNDLGKIAKSGTVSVTDLFAVEKYPTVFQMTSTITAELQEVRKESLFYDLFQALFPCGSITGAPKLKTMEIIDTLEQEPREMYCGTIGYLTPGGNSIFNVAIRTVIIDTEKGTAEYGVGGGITWGSENSSEYEEAIAKAAVLHEPVVPFELMETIRLEHQQYWLLDLHIDRLEQSASYFDIPFNREYITQALESYALTLLDQEVYRINLFLDKYGQHRLMASPFQSDSVVIMQAILAQQPIKITDKFMYHKTTHRSTYNNHKEFLRNRNMEVLLWNENEEITEFTIGNIVVKHHGEWWTPPVSSGLLRGVHRRHLLKQGKIREKVLYVKDIPQFEEIWLINSLRGWVQIVI